MASQETKFIKTNELSEGMTIETPYHGIQTIETIGRYYGGNRPGYERALDITFTTWKKMVAEPGVTHKCLDTGLHFGYKYTAKVYYAGGGMPGGQVQPLDANVLESLAIRVTTRFGFVHLSCDLEELAAHIYGESGYWQMAAVNNGDFLICHLIRELTPLEDFMVPNENVRKVLAKLQPRKWAGDKIPYGPVVVIKRIQG